MILQGMDDHHLFIFMVLSDLVPHQHVSSEGPQASLGCVSIPGSQASRTVLTASQKLKIKMSVNELMRHSHTLRETGSCTGHSPWVLDPCPACSVPGASLLWAVHPVSLLADFLVLQQHVAGQEKRG